METHWLWKGMLFGLGLAAPVGPMAILCIHRSMDRGWKAGLSTGMGIACADGVYASLAAAGWFLVAARIPAIQMGFQLAGGGGLVIIGLSILRKPPGIRDRGFGDPGKGMGPLRSS